MKRVLSLVSLLILAAVLAAPAFAADASDLAGRAAMWEKEYNAGNLKGVVALYAADACRMPPYQDAVHGGDAILAQLKTGLEKGGVKIKITVTSAETSGDLGTGAGTFELMGKDGSTIDKGKWMDVSKKTGGKWVFQCDIWNSSNPMPTGEMKK